MKLILLSQVLTCARISGLGAMGSYICRYRTEDFSCNDGDLSLEDRTVLGMAISLFAVSDSLPCELVNAALSSRAVSR